MKTKFFQKIRKAFFFFLLHPAPISTLLQPVAERFGEWLHRHCPQMIKLVVVLGAMTAVAVMRAENSKFSQRYKAFRLKNKERREKFLERNPKTAAFLKGLLGL